MCNVLLKENIKKLSKVFEKSVKGSVYKFSAQLSAVQDSLEMVDLQYAVDIMGPSKSHSEGATFKTFRGATEPSQPDLPLWSPDPTLRTPPPRPDSDMILT